MNKKCTLCQINKNLNQYNKKKSTKDGLQNVCKLCNREKSRAYYAKNKIKQRKQINFARRLRVRKRTKFIQRYKRFCGCKFCNEKESVALDFHHIKDKDVLVSKMASEGYTIQEIKNEIRKCIVVCANCHRKLHAGIISL